MKWTTKKQLIWCRGLYISMKLANNNLLGCMFVTYTDICKHMMFTVQADLHGTSTRFHFHVRLKQLCHATTEEMKNSLQAFFGPTDLHPTHREPGDQGFPVILPTTLRPACRRQGAQGCPAALPPTLQDTPCMPPTPKVPLAGGHAEVGALMTPACLHPKVTIAGGHAKVKARLLLGCQPASSCSPPYALRLRPAIKVPLAGG